MDGIPRSVESYDEIFDVVVVGYGFAGSISALEAARAGAKVLLIEKTGVPGGISICSYGAVRCAMDEERAYAYLTATNAGRTSDEVVRTLARGMSGLEPYVRDLARVNDAELMTTIETGKTGANYPLPGFDAFYQTVVVSVPNFDARAVYPWANGAPGGPMLFKIIDDNLANESVEIRLNSRGVRLLTADDGSEIRGITVEGPDGVGRIAARRGVILASGGFEGSPERQDQYWEGRPVLPAAARHNTGDGIVMSQDVGAELWHMWHFHGAYGFRNPDPDYPYAIRVKRLPDWRPGGGGFMARRDETGEISDAQVKMTWILLDRDGAALHERVPALHPRHRAPPDAAVRHRAPGLPAHPELPHLRRERAQALPAGPADIERPGAAPRLERRQSGGSRVRHPDPRGDAGGARGRARARSRRGAGERGALERALRGGARRGFRPPARHHDAGRRAAVLRRPGMAGGVQHPGRGRCTTAASG